MLSKFMSSKFVIGSSVSFSLLAIFFYATYKFPFIDSLSLSIQKIFIFSLLALIATLFYFLGVAFFKQNYIPEGKLSRILFFLIPISVLISAIFAKESFYAFFGEGLVIDSAVSFIALTFLAYMISVSSAFMPKITWFWFSISSFLVTIPIIIAVILVRLGLIPTANYFTKLIDSWDTVAAVSIFVIIFTLVYVETIAYNKFQKILGSLIIILHLILALSIVMVDTWYALTLSTLIILFVNRKNFKTNYYKRASFYVFLLSLILSLILTFSTSISQKFKSIPDFSQKIQTWSTNFSKINYNFVKPNLNTSLNIGFQGLKNNNLFGEGPGRFYTLWRTYKPQEVINSNFWEKDFTSSYSALTTYFGTLGLFGLIAFLLIIVAIFVAIKNKLNSISLEDLDDENKFYLLSSVAIFISSTVLMFIFGNTIISTLLFVTGVGLVVGRIIKWKENKNISQAASIISLFLLLILVSGFIVNLNKVRAISIYNNSLLKFQTDNNIGALENSLIKVTKILGDDSSYSQLSKFYVQKAQYILNNSSSTEIAKKDFLNTANNSIQAAQTAIKLNPYNYNNHMTLGAAHELQSMVDKDGSYTRAKEAYIQAKNLYPNNPYIPLVLARLEWTSSQNSTSTSNKIVESLQIKQNYSLAYDLLSQLAIQNNDKESAKKYSLQSITADNNNLNAYLQYGILTLNEKNLTEAEAAFFGVLRLDSSSVNAIYYLSVTYILAGKFDEAQKLIEALKVKLPNSEEIVKLQAYFNQSKNPATAPAPVSATTTNSKTKVVKKK